MISVRSEVQVLPGPPLRNPQGLSFVSSTKVSGAVAQLGERLLCKQDVVGSIPSGSTIALVLSRDEIGWQVIRIKVCGELLGSPLVLFDIVKRRFVRTS